MSRRRALAVVVAGCALLAGVVVAVPPLASATPAPTPQQLAAARARVAQAAKSLDDVQAQAEQAAEAFNGAQVKVGAAQEASGRAAAAATQAQGVAVAAEADSVAARGAAVTAAGEADRAREQHAQAVQSVLAAQRALDQLAAGAYRSGGTIAFLSAMIDADPLTLATGREMINRADQHQRSSVDTLSQAKDAAATAAVRSTEAEQAAADQAEQVGLRAAEAARTSAAARTAAAGAASAAAEAVRAADAAEAARQHAQTLVSAAEQALGSATATAADLTAKAEQARREAEALQRQPLPAGSPITGSAAAIAIAWAYKEVGTPYSWGGGNAGGPTLGFAQGARTVGFDCSGLTLFAYAHAGIRLDHFTGSQWNAGRHVSRTQLLPGDLMFFANNISDPSTIHHVSIYLGNDRMIEAPHTGDVVKVASAVRRDFIGGVRLTG